MEALYLLKDRIKDKYRRDHRQQLLSFRAT
jgi:hypothetical protein